jgi:hypothetical protein
MADENSKVEDKDKGVGNEDASKGTAGDKTPEVITKEEHRRLIQDVVSERESLKSKYRETRDRLSTLEKQLENVPSAETIQKILDEKKALEVFKAETEKLKEEEKLKNASEVEKLQFQLKKTEDTLAASLAVKEAEFQKTLTEREEELKRATSNVTKLRNFRRDNEILKAASEHDAYNPQQIVSLLEKDFEYDEETDSFVCIVRKGGKKEKEMSVADRVKEFLTDVANENLIKSKVKSGSGTKKDGAQYSDKGGGAPSNASKYMRTEDEILAEEAEDRGFTLENWKKIKAREAEIKARKK